MARDPDDEPRKNEDESVDDMFQHLDDAKERYKTAKRREQTTSTSLTPLQQAIQTRADVAVLASNHEARLNELEANDAVTHRSSKGWKTAKLGVDAHGRLPIYYRQEGLVTHTGYISDIIINPSDNTAAAKKFVEHITDADTYDEYHEQLDTTTFIVTNGERLDEPFSQSDLALLSGKGHVSENYSRQPAYVIHRPGDFPHMP